MKIIAAWLPLVLFTAPVAASIQLGTSEWPEKKYASVRACERALFALVKVEMARRKAPDREATVSDNQLTIRTFVDGVYSWQVLSCRGSYLSDVRGSVVPQSLPPTPKP